MKLIQCENNHYYSDKLFSCPYCAKEKANVIVEDASGKKQQQIDTFIFSRRDMSNRQSGRKTVGWLVCIEGEMMGESFDLREGENLIGRAAHMDVALLYESTVSREGHAAICYDKDKNNYYIYSFESEGKIYCNNRQVKSRKAIRDRDIITLGDCSLMFVAFCDSSFTWGD